MRIIHMIKGDEDTYVVNNDGEISWSGAEELILMLARPHYTCDEVKEILYCDIPRENSQIRMAFNALWNDDDMFTTLSDAFNDLFYFADEMI